MERPALQPILAPFDGFHESEHAVTGTCLISFDRNRYSVMSTAARRTVQVRSYADRIVIRCGDAIVGEHERHFGRNRTIYDPWHYLPVLAHKPGALRNGAPFQDWDLPPALHRLRRRLGTGDEADRRFVRVLSAVLMSCPLLSGPSTMTVWTKEGTTNACQEAQARGDHREAARG